VKISEFSSSAQEPQPEPESEPVATPDDLATLVAYGTELLAMAIHEASDKLVAAILAAKLAELETARPAYSESATAALRDGLFQGYNTVMAALQSPDEQGENDDEEKPVSEQEEPTREQKADE
jgi:hypothetical protein